MKKIDKILSFISISLLFVSIAMFIVAPEFGQFNFGLVSLTLIGTLALILRNRIALKLFVKTKLFKSIIINIINMTLMISILAIINFLVVKNDYYIDFTTNKLHTLSDQSKDALKLLSNDKIKVSLFAKRGTWNRYLNLLNLYRNENKSVELDVFDVEKEVALVNLYKVNENGTIVIEYKNKTYKTIATNELAVTNLLLKILNPIKKKVYYSVGHNELALNDKNPIGGNFLKEKILNSNLDLSPLELHRGIPSDATGVMILNPQIEFLPIEIQNLKKYIINGGSLLTTLSPQFNGVMIKNYLSFLSEFGVNYNNALILDRLAVQQGSQASIPVVNSYDTTHKITENITDRTLFPVSGVISLVKNDVFKWKSLAKSTPFPGSWGEVNFEEIKSGKAKYNELIDFKGPLNIFVAGESKKSRILVYGSSNFISNQFQGQSNNFNLFLNSLSWMLRDESLMSLNRPKLEGNLIYISEIQTSLIFYFTVLFFPFLFFAVGIFAYQKKLSR